MSRVLFTQCFGTNKYSKSRTAAKKTAHPCPCPVKCSCRVLTILALCSGSLHGFCLHSASGFIISSVCVTKPSNPVVSSDYRTVCLKCRGVWDWEMAQQFRVCWPYRGHAYRSQHPRPVAHNNLCLQIQGIGCPLLACIDTCTYMCIQPSMYIEIKLNA